MRTTIPTFLLLLAALTAGCAAPTGTDEETTSSTSEALTLGTVTFDYASIVRSSLLAHASKCESAALAFRALQAKTPLLTTSFDQEGWKARYAAYSRHISTCSSFAAAARAAAATGSTSEMQSEDQLYGLLLEKILAEEAEILATTSAVLRALDDDTKAILANLD